MLGQVLPGVADLGGGPPMPLAIGLIPTAIYSNGSAQADLLSGYSRRPVVPVWHSSDTEPRPVAKQTHAFDETLGYS